MKKTLAVFIAGVFLFTNTLSWAKEEDLFSAVTEHRVSSSGSGNKDKLAAPLRSTLDWFKERFLAGEILVSHKYVNVHIENTFLNGLAKRDGTAIDIRTSRFYKDGILEFNEIDIVAIPGLLEKTGIFAHIGLGRAIEKIKGQRYSKPTIYIDSKLYYDESVRQHEADEVVQWELLRMWLGLRPHQMRQWILDHFDISDESLKGTEYERLDPELTSAALAKKFHKQSHRLPRKWYEQHVNDIDFATMLALYGEAQEEKDAVIAAGNESQLNAKPASMDMSGTEKILPVLLVNGAFKNELLSIAALLLKEGLSYKEILSHMSDLKMTKKSSAKGIDYKKIMYRDGVVTILYQTKEGQRYPIRIFRTDKRPQCVDFSYILDNMFSAGIRHEGHDSSFIQLAASATDNIAENIKRKKQKGKVVDLRDDEYYRGRDTVIVSDLHGRPEYLDTILKDIGWDSKSEGEKPVLVINGDIIGSSTHYMRGERGVEEGYDRRADDMTDSIRLVRKIIELKSKYPCNVFFVVGNHENPYWFASHHPYSQQAVFQTAFIEEMGNEALDTYIKFLDSSPLLLLADNLVVCHAGPIKGNVLKGLRKKAVANRISVLTQLEAEAMSLNTVDTKKSKKDGTSSITLATYLTRSMHRLVSYNQHLVYTETDAKAFLDAIDMKEATFVVGHDHDFDYPEEHERLLGKFRKRGARYTGPPPQPVARKYPFYAKVYDDMEHYIVFSGGSTPGYALFSGKTLIGKRTGAESFDNLSGAAQKTGYTEKTRPANRLDQPGDLVNIELQRGERAIVIGDLHTKLDNLNAILSEEDVMQDLASGRLHIICLGDYLIPVEKDLAKRPDRGYWQKAEFDTIVRLAEIKNRYPGRVHLIQGNGEMRLLEYFDRNLRLYHDNPGKLHPKRKAFFDYVIKNYGEEILLAMRDFIKNMPLFIKLQISTRRYIMDHGAIIEGAEDTGSMINFTLDHSSKGMYEEFLRLSYEKMAGDNPGDNAAKERALTKHLDNLGADCLIVGHMHPYDIPPEIYLANNFKPSAANKNMLTSFDKLLTFDALDNMPSYLDICAETTMRSQRASPIENLRDKPDNTALKNVGAILPVSLKSAAMEDISAKDPSVRHATGHVVPLEGKGSPADCLEMIKTSPERFPDRGNKTLFDLALDRNEGIIAREVSGVRDEFTRRTINRGFEILKALGIFVPVEGKRGYYRFSDMMLGPDENYTKTLINAINDIRYQIGKKGNECPLRRGDIPDGKIGLVKELVKMAILHQINIMQRPTIPEGKILWHILERDVVSVPQRSSFAQKVNNAAEKSDAPERIYILKGKESIKDAISRISKNHPEAIYDVALSTESHIKNVPGLIKRLVFKGTVGDVAKLEGLIAALRALHGPKEDVVSTLKRIYAVLKGTACKYEISPDDLDDPVKFARSFIFDLPPATPIPVDEIPKVNQRLLQLLIAA